MFMKYCTHHEDHDPDVWVPHAEKGAEESVYDDVYQAHHHHESY